MSIIVSDLFCWFIHYVLYSLLDMYQMQLHTYGNATRLVKVQTDIKYKIMQLFTYATIYL